MASTVLLIFFSFPSVSDEVRYESLAGNQRIMDVLYAVQAEQKDVELAKKNKALPVEHWFVFVVRTVFAGEMKTLTPESAYFYFMQAIHETVRGNYTVGDLDAITFAALQVQAMMGEKALAADFNIRSAICRVSCRLLH